MNLFVNVAHAQGFFGPIVPDCGPCGCGFPQFVTLAQNIMNFTISMAIVIFILLIAYSGFLLVTNAASPSNIAQAKKIMWAALIGFVIVLGAWLIVDTILKTFLADGNWNNILEDAGTSICSQNFTVDGVQISADPVVAAGQYKQLAAEVSSFISANSANGLKAEYEVKSTREKNLLVENGVPADSIKVVSHITAPHFSVYGSYGCAGKYGKAASPEVQQCADCADFGDYGIATKDGTKATKSVVEALAKVSQTSGVPYFRVTEAYPVTSYAHVCGCQYDGSCVDVNF